MNAGLVELMGPQLVLLLAELDERARRLTLGAVARAAGDGGITAVVEATGVSWQTVANGAAELESGPGAPPGRVRRPGGGRKPLTQTDPGLVAALLGLVGDSTRGDPGSPLMWTTRSVANLARELVALGHRCSPQSVWRLLHEQGFSTQANAKVTEGKRHPDRDAQFRHIAAQAAEHLAGGQPVVSVDAKKKELVGEFAQAGREWRPRGDPVRVRSHSFAEVKGGGHAIPYGVYDVGANTGFVNVGVDHNTAGFALESIRRWWDQVGSGAYPHARRLLITCDAGGANGWRNRAWKTGLAALAQDTGLQVTVCHFPPGTSKWNRIEHRLFSQITLAWRGRPLTSHDVIINTIGAVTTATGLRATAVLDDTSYPTGTQISDEQMHELEHRALQRHDFHGEWNYTLLPVWRPAPPPRPQRSSNTDARAALAPVVAALASPELTGLPRADLTTLTADLQLPWAAAREQRLHLSRSGAPRTRTRPAGPVTYTLETMLLATIYHHRHGMPYSNIAALLGADHSTFGPAVRTITNLLGTAHPALAAGPEFIYTPADLRAYAATAGITIPDPPPRKRPST